MKIQIEMHCEEYDDSLVVHTEKVLRAVVGRRKPNFLQAVDYFVNITLEIIFRLKLTKLGFHHLQLFLHSFRPPDIILNHGGEMNSISQIFVEIL